MGSAAWWEGNKDVSLYFIVRNVLEPSGTNREIVVVRQCWLCGMEGRVGWRH